MIIWGERGRKGRDTWCWERELKVTLYQLSGTRGSNSCEDAKLSKMDLHNCTSFIIMRGEVEERGEGGRGRE